MAEVVVQGTLKPDGTLELKQPVNLPPGEVRVIVQAVSTPAVPAQNPLAVLEQIWSERRALGLAGRSGEQIDADIAAMRAEWEDHQLALERIQVRPVKE